MFNERVGFGWGVVLGCVLVQGAHAQALPPATEEGGSPGPASTVEDDAPIDEPASVSAVPVEPVPELPPPAVTQAAIVTLDVENADIYRPRCGVRPYLEPSLFVSLGSYSSVPKFLPQESNVGAPTSRMAAGVLIRGCASGRESIHIRIGLSAVMSGLRWSGNEKAGNGFHEAGFGPEAEVGWPLAARLRLGARLGGEKIHGAWVVAAGARLRYREIAWLGVDLYRVERRDSWGYCDDTAVRGCFSSTTGAMIGFGFEGKTGAIISAAEVSIGLLAIAVALGSIH